MKGSSFVPLVICSSHQQTLLNLVYFIYLHNFHWLLSEQYLPNQSPTNQNAGTLTIVTMPIVQVAYQKICCLSIIATTVLLFFHHSEIGIPPPSPPHKFWGYEYMCTNTDNCDSPQIMMTCTHRYKTNMVDFLAFTQPIEHLYDWYITCTAIKSAKGSVQDQHVFK